MSRFFRTQFPLTPLAKMLRVGVLGTSLLGVALTHSALAQAQVVKPETASLQRSYHIPPGTLAQSLNRFASEAGITLSFTPDLVEGKQAPEIKGNFDPQSGLQYLLRDSGLELVIKPDGSFSLKPATKVGRLAAVKVTTDTEVANTG